MTPGSLDRLFSDMSDASAVDVDGVPERCERPKGHADQYGCGYLVSSDDRMTAVVNGQCGKKCEDANGC